MKDILSTAPGPRMPRPMNPILTLSILGAEYPHMLNAAFFVPGSCALTSMPLASTDEPSVMLRMKLRLLVDIPIMF
jgi:hypothetical protein